MPFISKDWRGPGEEWVRFEGGWEMKKCVIHLNQNNNNNSDSEGYEDIDDEVVPAVVTVTSNNSSNDIVGKSRVKMLLRHFERNLNNTNYDNVDTTNDDNDGVAIITTSSPNSSSNSKDRKDNSKTKTRTRSNDNEIITKPYYPITIKCTKEIAGFNELSEALLRLDFPKALRDIRRFNYVSKVIHMLLRHDKLSTLSGGAQRILFRMLEDMADYVYETNCNQHVLNKLLQELHSTMTIYHVWGSHLGSSILFRQHVESRRKITEFVERMQEEYKQDLALCSTGPSSRPGLVSKLPEECIREILLRLSDHHDLDRASKTCVTMKDIVKEKRIWRELVQTHFTKSQVEYALNNCNSKLRERKDWRALYDVLKKRFPIRDAGYTESLVLCRLCCALFWQSIGHPCCLLDDVINSRPQEGEEENEKNNMNDNFYYNNYFVPVKPQTFLSFFSI